jgi:pyridoxal phosphate enzyme (YggS family)
VSATEAAIEIGTRLGAVRQRIAQAALRAGRDPAEITLVAVSKTHGPEVVRAAVQAGQLVFGENRVEEAIPKIEGLAGVTGLEWHMIGHIQSRKVRDVDKARFALLHSVDTVKVGQRLAALAAQAGRRQAVLVEMNVSGEASKSGFAAAAPERWPDLLPSLAELAGAPGLDVRGLMTIAPQVEQPEHARPVFERLRQLQDYLARQLPGLGPVLSMGMTDDFEVAIEAGATMVRIGRAIFGERG